MKNLLGIVLLFLVTACGTDVNVDGETKHTLEGEAEIRVVLDVELCDGLTGPEYTECVQAVVKILSALQEKEKAKDE